MRVDRARFLELVTAIAATPLCACQTSPPEARVVVAPLDIKPIAETTPGASGAGAGGARGDARPGAIPPIATDTGAGIWALPYDPSAPPKTCGQLRCGGPTSEAMGALRNSCRTLEIALKPEPFQRFMTCMMAVNGTPDTCDLRLVGTEPGECLERWSSPPVVDPATAAKCKPIVAACAGANRSPHADEALTMETCQGILSVTSPRAERKMIHCVTEYCEGARTLCYSASM